MAKIKRETPKLKSGFSFVELFVMVIIVAILFAITFVTYAGLSQQAQYARIRGDLYGVNTLLASYASEHDGKYPTTTDGLAENWKTIDVRTDLNCFNGSSQADWVPGFDLLPQSVPNTGIFSGVNGNSGCYLYASNGDEYVLSAWNVLSAPQSTGSLYRRQGFRSFQTPTSAQFYSCNDNAIGGISQGKYVIDKDYYKHSLTITNILSCDETPPSGS